MSDVQFSIGGSAAPFKSAMQEATEAAKESGAKITESLGIEGVKSERALHGRLSSAFKDLTASGTNSAEAIGGAFENMTEGLKLSMGGMIALLVFTELVKSAYEGYEAVNKMKEGIKGATEVNSDISKKSLEGLTGRVEELKERAGIKSEVALSTDAATDNVEETKNKVEEVKMQVETPSQLIIDTAVANESLEETNDKIKKLKDDAAASDLSTQSSLTAGWEVTIQALEEHKAISEIVREDAENTYKLQKEAHDLEDASGAKTIKNANDILQLKLEGHDKEASALQHEQEMQEKLLTAKGKGNQETIDALNQEMALEDQIAEKEERKQQRAKDAKLDSLEMQLHVDQLNSTGKDADKLKAAQDETTHARLAMVQIEGTSNDPIAIEQARIEYQRALNKEKEVQAGITKKAADTEKEISEEQRKRKEVGETDAQKLQDATEQRKKDEAALSTSKGDKQEKLNLQLALEKSITAEKEAQTKVDEQAKKFAEDKAKFLLDQKEAQQAVQAAQVDASLFHGEVSSLAKTGLGGRVSGPNYGNQAQLKAAEAAAKHLAEINAAFKKIAGSIGST